MAIGVGLLFLLAAISWLLLKVVRINEDLRDQVSQHEEDSRESARRIEMLQTESSEKGQTIADMSFCMIMVFNDKDKKLAAAHRYVGHLLEEKAERNETVKLRVVKNVA